MEHAIGIYLLNSIYCNFLYCAIWIITFDQYKMQQEATFDKNLVLQ